MKRYWKSCMALLVSGFLAAILCGVGGMLLMPLSSPPHSAGDDPPSGSPRSVGGEVAQAAGGSETPTYTSTPEATNTPAATDTPDVTNTPNATDTPDVTNTPVATDTATVPDDGITAAAIEVVAGVDVTSLQVADGRAEGGERVMIVSFVVDPAGDVGEQVWATMLAAWGAAESEGRDIDVLSLVYGTSAAATSAIVTVQADDVRLYLGGALTADEFVERMEIVEF